MGRRSIANDPVKVREAAARQLATLLSRYDLAEFQAQIHAVEMIDGLVGFSRDMSLPAQFRAQCMNDVLDRAVGKPASKATMEVVDLRANAGNGRTVADEIASAKVAAEVYAELDDLVRRKVHPTEWPEAVRLAAGDAISFFAEDAAE